MEKLLFVCLGNICRSPLAEGVMLHLKAQHQLDNIEVDSAGTAGYHIGEAPDKRTVLNAKKNGIDISSLRARQFSKQDFEHFDQIYVMDKNNLHHVLRLAEKESHKNKVQLFLDGDAEVPDPYYGTSLDFEKVFWLVYKKCESLAGINK